MSLSSENRQAHDPEPGVRSFARAALLVEPLTGLGISAVLWAVTYLGGHEAAVAGTGAALLVAAVAGVVIYGRRPFSLVRGVVLALILLAIGLAGVATATDSLDTPVLPVLVVLCAGPGAWVVLWPERAATGLRRFLVAAAVVVPLGFVSFAVGVYVTPFVLLTALGAWLVTRAFPSPGWPARAGVVAAGVTVTAVGGVVAAVATWSPGSSLGFSVLAFSAPTVALVLVAVAPCRLPVLPFVLVVVALVAALAYDVLAVLPTVGAGGDFGPRLAAGAAFGHLGVTWAAARSVRGGGSSRAPSDDPVVAPHADVPAP